MAGWSFASETYPAFSYSVFLKVTQERTVIKNEFSLVKSSGAQIIHSPLATLAFVR